MPRRLIPSRTAARPGDDLRLEHLDLAQLLDNPRIYYPQLRPSRNWRRARPSDRPEVDTQLAASALIPERELTYVSTLDAVIIVVYFVAMIGMGVWQQRQAAKSIESYFLGGNRIHWLALAMSGSVSTFDITGTMWMVTLVYLFGMKSIWNHWMWGFLMAAFFMSYMGKWVRRSRVMTGAEWMITRFGDRPDGRAARLRVRPDGGR